MEAGIYSVSEALRVAEGLGLDLVEVSPKVTPPVCRVVDYKKFLYQKKRKQKELKQKTAKVVLKEIRFGPQTDDHDYEFKKRHGIRFLQEGARLKAFVFFRGRSIVYGEQGEMLLLRLAQDLEPYARVEQMPKLEGKKMTMFFVPKKNSIKKS